MTILDAITAAGRIQPDDFGNEEKVQWLSDFDGQVWLDVFQTHEGCPDGEFAGYDKDTDIETTELLIPAPYTNVYPLYLTMMADMHGGDITRYTNSRAVWENAYGNFTNWYNRTHMPIGVRAVRF